MFLLIIMEQLSLVQRLEEKIGTVVCAGRPVSNQFLKPKLALFWQLKF